MKYFVLGNITFDCRSYKRGEQIELTEDQAAAMPWAVSRTEPEPQKPSTRRMFNNISDALRADAEN